MVMMENQVKQENNERRDRRGTHPNSLANLRPNLNGRPPKDQCLTSIAREELAKSCPYAPDKTWAQYLVERWLGQCAGHSGYFRELIERLEGKVTQPIDATVESDVNFIIGKGYANKPDSGTDKQDTG